MRRMSICLLSIFAMMAMACSAKQEARDAQVAVQEPVSKLAAKAAPPKKTQKTLPKIEPPKPWPLKAWTGQKSESWKEVKKLLGEQKVQAALKKVEVMLAEAKTKNDGEEQTRCLLNLVQMRSGLHGYEKAVRFLLEQEWPKDLLSQTALNLYHAQGLIQYTRAYSWEIRKREQVRSKGPVDLKAWTMGQIYAEAHRALGRAWQHREQLGKIPAKQLEEYLRLNNYPRDIRGSLRDTTAYLWVSLLNDSQGWSPTESNSVYNLDLKSLFANQDLGNPLHPIHPLQRIAAITADLENWHRQENRPEAAFEARLERLRALHRHLSMDEDRGAIRVELKKNLQGLKKLPWWSLGMHQLAQFTLAEQDAEKNIRARAIAAEGLEAFPESLGGKRCEYLIKNIERPGYQLSAMAADAPNKPSIELSYKNLKRIYFRAYVYDLPAQLRKSKDSNLLPDYREIRSWMKKRKAGHSWQVDLKATPDFSMHRRIITPPKMKPGAWIIVASGQEKFGRTDNLLQAVHILVSDLVLVTQREGNTLDAMLVSGETGLPVPGAKMVLYRTDWRHGHRPTKTLHHCKNGHARFKLSQNHSQFVFASKGAQMAIDPNYVYGWGRDRPRKTTSALLYTDRSIYRPGQKIHFKAVVYSGRADLGKLSISPKRKLRVRLMDANYQEVDKIVLTSNEFGTAAGSFRIPTGRALGAWSLRAINHSQSIRVEEYKRPTFETKLLEPEQALRLNQPAEIQGEARYYFGLPVTEGQVVWQVRRNPVYPSWWYWWGGISSPNRNQMVAQGTSTLDDEGKFTIQFKPEADKRLADDKHLSYRYAVHADVTDEGGETRVADRSFRLGFVAVEARFEAKKGFALAGKPSAWTMHRSDLDGSPAAGDGNWRLLALKQAKHCLLPADQPQNPQGLDETFKKYMSPDDLKRKRHSPGYNAQAVLRSWADGKELARGKLKHDAEGKAEIELASLPAGVYRLRYETKDDYGSPFDAQTEFLVGDRDFAPALPAMLLIESPKVSVGGTARVLATSGLDDQPLFYEIHRNGAHIERHQYTAGKDPALIEIPIKAEHRGGFTVMLWLVRDHQFISMQRSVFVPWDEKKLKIEFSTFRDKLKPGQTEEWTIKVSKTTGTDATVPAAEILAYMYDRSLDSFTPHNPFDPIRLYPNRSGAAQCVSTLRTARRIWIESLGFKGPGSYPNLQIDALKTISGYALGGPGSRHQRMVRGPLGNNRLAGDMVDAPLAAAAEPAESKDALSDDEDISAGVGRAGIADKRSKGKGGGGARRAREASGLLESPSTGSHAPEAPAQTMRTNFSETAFWQPQLRTDPNGEARIVFTVPDSVTSWKVWLHAITKDMASGSLMKEAQSVKELMVRPYLPRFLREGDEARIKVVVNNASKRKIEGKLDFDIIDPESKKSLLAEFGLSSDKAQGQPFSVEAGAGTNLEFIVHAPARVGQVAIRVQARSGEFSDGELRPIPLLPGRMHLFQSRFVTLKDAERRELFFEDLAKNDDPSRVDEQMVVTLDGQLFYQVLSALPYMINYPYECTEQTLNRFVSTGILSSMYKDFPAVARMAKKLSARDTRNEAWKADDANRKMALEETPWLRTAKGGGEDIGDLIKVLDPRIARAQRYASLARLKKMQNSNGSFPWFSGGPPSVYMTTYLLHGFAKAMEFGVDVPKNVVRRAFGYLHSHFLREILVNMRKHDCCWEAVTFLNYVLSNYPDASWHGFSEAERKEMLNFSFKHWKQHAPYLKGQLALTLHRAKRAKHAKLVWASVMDSAQTKKDQGTFWAPEDRAWLWYNDTIETHAFALRTLMELEPKNTQSDGLVLWLLLNKKMNHWKSTRATAEVIYSLAHYLKAEGALGVEERIHVTAGDESRDYVFKPDEFTGKGQQWVIPGKEIVPEKTAKVIVEKKTKGYLFASATWHYSTEKMPTEARGDVLHVERSFFKRIKTADGAVLDPLTEGAQIKIGDEIEVQLSIRAKSPMEYVHLRDPRAAGMEPTKQVSRHRWDLGISWYEEIRDSGTNFFFERLPKGQYTFKYRIRAAMAGSFKVSPATLQSMYAPEFTAFSQGHGLKIAP
ncbi:MAG: hypothetical protein JRF33_04765 [Deltaproteobacteria bacterium]|nr:hypothetical protein [Deltaproteobacteria bacterium]